MSASLTETIGRVAGGQNLSREETTAAFDLLMQGAATDEQIGLLLMALRAKGETVEEIAGAASSLRRHMTCIRSERSGLLDTCGTGGDQSGTFNISTAAAIVTAAAGVPVAKHGNRSYTSKSGSADVLAELGVNISATVEQVETCLDELGICFCFAPLMHPSMKNVAAVRKALAVPTIFNLLGPLVNPAGAEFQLLGVGRPEVRPLVAEALQLLGSKRALVVCGDDGLDEVTLAGETHVTEVSPEGLREFTWTPEEFDLPRSPLDALKIETPAESAAMIRRVLAGEKGPPRDIVVLNAAAALVTAARANRPKDAAKAAAAAIDSGAAAALLARLAERSHRPA
jgi:anthranilate phosphoribosyltransferase